MNPTPDQLREQIADWLHNNIDWAWDYPSPPDTSELAERFEQAVVAPVLEALGTDRDHWRERCEEARGLAQAEGRDANAARAERDEARAEVARLRAVVTSALAELRRGGQTSDDRRRAADEILAAASDSGRGSVPATPPEPQYNIGDLVLYGPWTHPSPIRERKWDATHGRWVYFAKAEGYAGVETTEDKLRPASSETTPEENKPHE